MAIVGPTDQYDIKLDRLCCSKDDGSLLFLKGGNDLIYSGLWATVQITHDYWAQYYHNLTWVSGGGDVEMLLNGESGVKFKLRHVQPNSRLRVSMSLSNYQFDTWEVEVRPTDGYRDRQYDGWIHKSPKTSSSNSIRVFFDFSADGLIKAVSFN